jgi:hypothetical protein
MRLRVLDYAAILLSLATIAAFSVLVYGGGRNSPRVVIEGSGREWIYPLEADQRVEVQGPIGITVVRIHGGAVRVEKSPCKNQICVLAGEIRKTGDWVACLPNKVIVRITGSRETGGVDAASY